MNGFHVAEKIQKLRAEVRGSVVTPGDADFDSAAFVFSQNPCDNSKKEPSVIVSPLGDPCSIDRAPTEQFARRHPVEFIDCSAVSSECRPKWVRNLAGTTAN